MSRARRSGRFAEAYVPFFLAAVAFAAVSVPLWALMWSGRLPLPPVSPLAFHAHEMLLGYGLAVVGGFLFNKISRRQLAFALAAWLAGRLAIAFGLPTSWAGAAVSLAFPLCVLAFAALPFARAARTGHNLVFAPVLGAFTVAELLFQLGTLGVVPDGERRGVMLALDLLSLLMLVMGGRIIPAATAGVVRDKGGFLAQRVQPLLEWGGIGGLTLALVLDTALWLPAAAGAGSLLAGGAALVRLARWKTRWTLDVPAMWSLHLGYAWLGIGLILKGLAQLFGVLPIADAVHGITVGALGTLTLAMMMRTTLQRRGLVVEFGAAATSAVLLTSTAALLRLLAPVAGPATMTTVAAGFWAAAMLAAATAMAGALYRSARESRLAKQ